MESARDMAIRVGFLVDEFSPQDIAAHERAFLDRRYKRGPSISIPKGERQFEVSVIEKGALTCSICSSDFKVDVISVLYSKPIDFCPFCGARWGKLARKK